MYYDQTAMQQYLGHDPIVNSLVYKRVKYPTIFDAQRAYTQDQNAFYQEKEQEQLALEARGIKAFKNMNDAIRGRLNPTEDGLANQLERPLKPMGEVSKGIFERFRHERVHEPSVRSADMASVQAYSPEIQVSEDKHESVQEQWKPVEGEFPLLVFETKNKMDDFDAPDMTYGNESRSVIESYGLMQPFKNKMRYSPSMGYDVVSEDQFNLPASEHFKRMRSLGNIFSSQLIGQVMGFETSHVFAEMVDKFQRNEGGYFESPELTLAMKNHESTDKFHKEILKCLKDNLRDGVLPRDILSMVIKYMNSDVKGEGAPLPQFYVGSLPFFHKNLTDGTVLAVHGIWSMRVYVESLEYKGTQVRGKLRFNIQDHFGLDVKDINHNSFDGNKDNDGKPYEWINGFRSWYLLQHFKGYGYKPFITKMEFIL